MPSLTVVVWGQSAPIKYLIEGSITISLGWPLDGYILLAPSDSVFPMPAATSFKATVLASST